MCESGHTQPSRATRVPDSVRISVLGLAVALAAAAPAAAAPPANDAPGAPDVFAPYSAENGVPSEQQAIAELAEATADPGITPCLGPRSFDRTVWFRVPEAPGPRELAVEAAGRTLTLVDLAAFVQPAGATVPFLALANACAGAGSGGADLSEEPTSGMVLRVPANRAVLLQVGRRGPRSTPDDERAVLSLSQAGLQALPAPPGDSAVGAPAVSAAGSSSLLLGGATLTEEDPFQAACPSTASVWRILGGGRSVSRTISVDGRHASTLTVFQGELPTGENALDCVNRERRGPLAMRVKARRGQRIWIRVGTDRPAATSRATLRIAESRVPVADGGKGGSDPTVGGPGGGLPRTCDATRPAKATVTGRVPTAAARARNRLHTIALSLRARGAVCDVQLRLIGPGGRTYARGAAVRMAGRERPRLERTRAFRRGGYRLRVTAIDRFGERRNVTTRVRGVLR